MNTTDSSVESHPFRNGEAGVEAKRLKLLRDRRDDLATMSHEIRGVYVNRFSRLLAAIALSVGGFGIMIASLDEELAASLAGLLPGENPAALSTMLIATWVLAAFALYSGRAWAERRFSVAMSKVVLPTDQLHNDVGRLEWETPAEVGRNIAQRLVPFSRMFSVLASGLILPVTALGLYLSLKAGGYPRVDDVELLFTAQAGNMAFIGVMAAIFSLRLAASPNWSPSVWTAMGVGLLLATVFTTYTSMLPTVVIGAFILATATYLNHRRRRKENIRIAREGTPVPQAIRFRKRARQLWEALTSLPNLFRWSTWQQAGLKLKSVGKAVMAYRPSAAQSMTTAILLMSAAALGVFYTSSSQEVQALHLVTPISSPDVDPISALKTGYSTARVEDGTQMGTTIDFHFAGSQSVDATAHLADAYIPSGWHAEVTVHRLQGDGHLQVQALDQVAGGATIRQISESTPSVTFEYTNCSGMDLPLFLKATPYGQWPEEEGSASVRYEVDLQMVSNCSF